MIKQGNAISVGASYVKFANPKPVSYFSLARCEDSTPPHGYDQVKTSLWSFTELCEQLEDSGCTTGDLGTVAELGIGESVSFGFPQGSYDGLIVTRIR